MKRFIYTFALLSAFVVLSPAQEPAGKAESHEGAAKEEAGDSMLGWKWANFGLLAFGLGYLMAKSLPPFFRSRSEDIQKGMVEAAKMKAEADAKVAEIEKKLAGVSSEIDRLRSQLRSEMSSEGERIQEETKRLAERIQVQAEQDIAFLTKAGRHELKAYSAALALDLAKQRIQARMNPDTQHSLIEGFVHDLRTENKGNAA